MSDIVWELQDLRDLDWSERATSSGTAGTYLKARKGTGQRMTYYKLSRYNGLEIDGYECVNEIIACRLMRALGISHLEYKLVRAVINLDGQEVETWVNSSKNFRQPKERKQAFGLFYDLNKKEGETPYELCVRMGWEDSIKQMMLVDYLIVNRDRHSSNIEVLAKPNGDLRLAPIFDNGLSLLAPYAGREDLIEQFDPLKPVGTTNFIGSRSLEENVEKAAPVLGISELRETEKKNILMGLQEILSEVHLEKIWDIIWSRWQHYENLRNHR